MEAAQLTTSLVDGQFKVVNVRPIHDNAEEIIVSKVATPELAAKSALGMNLMRSGKPGDLQARVYFIDPTGSLNMVRLYRRLGADRL
jgi:hypothetical protein